MNWITTNLRLPEDLYMELKLKAAKERKSVAAVIRELLYSKKPEHRVNKKELIERMKKLGKKIAKDHPGLNLSKKLIKMRYEQ